MRVREASKIFERKLRRHSTGQDLTRECEALVTVEAIAVSVVIGLTEISLIDPAVAETRVVVLRGVLVGSLALVARVVALTVVFLPCLLPSL